MTLVVKGLIPKTNAAFMAAFFIIVLALEGCSSELKIERLSGKTMGTNWLVLIAGPTNAHNNVALKAEIDSLLVAVNSEMSTYDPQSEISMFNQSTELNTWVPVSGRFARTTAKALHFAELSDGAFDPTIGPFSN